MSPVDGRDIWAGNYLDPIQFYEVRRRQIGKPMRWLDDPVRGMYITLAEWGAEPLPTTKKERRKREGGKRTGERYRRDRLAGLLKVERDLTVREEYELGLLQRAVAADRKKAKKKNKKTKRSTK